MNRAYQNKILHVFAWSPMTKLNLWCIIVPPLGSHGRHNYTHSGTVQSQETAQRHVEYAILIWFTQYFRFTLSYSHSDHILVHDCASLRQSWEAQSYTLRYSLVIGDRPKTCRICYTIRVRERKYEIMKRAYQNRIFCTSLSSLLSLNCT